MRTSNQKFIKMCETLIAMKKEIIKSFWLSRDTIEGRKLINTMISDIKVQKNYISLVNRNKLSA